MKLLQALILCFTVCVLFSQEQADAGFQYYYKEAVRLYEAENPTSETERKAIGYFNKTIEAVKKNPFLTTVLMDCYVKAGNLYQGQQKYINALPYYYNGIKTATEKKDSFFLYQFSLYLGTTKYSLSEIDSARFLFEKAAALSTGNQPFPDQPILFNSLGIIYYEASNYKQAINYFNQAVNRLPQTDTEYDESFVSFKNNIASCYAKLGEYQNALNQYKALVPYKQISEGLMQNIGHTFYSLEMYDSSMYYLKKAKPSETLNYARLVNEMALIYLTKGNLAQSEQMFDSAINLIRRLPGYYKNKDKASSYLYRSQLAEKQQLYNEAISWCNIALQELHFTFKAKRAADLPATVTDVVSPIVFFEVLQQKANLLYQKYKTEGEQQWGHYALQTWMLAIKTANYIKSNFDNDEAALFFNSNFSSRYKFAAALAVELYEQTSKEEYKNAFLLITESYKGNVLNANLSRSSAKASGILPDSLLNKEIELKQLLAVFTNRLNATVSDEGAALIRSKLTDIQVQLSRLHKQFETFPAYNSIDDDLFSDVITVTTIKENIGKGKAVVQMLWLDSTVLLFGCDNKESWLKKMVLSKENKTALQQTLASLYNFEEGIRFTGYEPSAQVYRLLKSSIPSSFFEKKHWVILADGLFNYLPFETLVTDKEERGYLAEEKIISYHYSLSSLISLQASAVNTSSSFAAAPFNSEGSNTNNFNFPQLPYSESEIEVWTGEKLKNSLATKQLFIKLAPKASVIHLATHAIAKTDSANQDQTFIQFYSKPKQQPDFTRLYLHELYSMRFEKKPLVILSACETATGINEAGEGLLSLGRGFLYSGCSGIISSLWKAEDKITAYLMKQTHGYLVQNFSADEALHFARIDFLKDGSIDARFKSPNYWGNFVYVGAVHLQKDRNIHTSSMKWIWIALLISLVSFVIWYFKKILHN